MKTLVYIGERFINESNSRMSNLYTEEGERSDWVHVHNIIESGSNVEIRQATEAELARYEYKLHELVKK